MEHPRRRFSDKVFNAIPGYLTVQDRDFKIIEANDAFKRNFGDFSGKYCYQIYKHRPERCEDCPVDRTFRDGQKHRSDEIVTTLDGREVNVLVYTTPIFDDDGNVNEVVEMSTDVTEIKQLQKQFKDSQARYHQLFEESPCFISIQDESLNVVDANRLHRETFGVGYGDKCYRLYKHREKECEPCTVRQTFQDGRARNHEEVVTSLSGEPINVLVHTAPLRNSDGEIEKVIEMSIDITQLRKLQDKLSSVGLLIGSIAHGIKNLLNGLDGGIYLVNTGLKKNNHERIDKGWEIALRNVRRIRSMVMDILYYAKDREPNWEEISTFEMVEDVCKIMKERAENQDIDFSYELDGKVGDFEADKQAIRSMLLNLIENSIDACRIDKNKSEHKLVVRLKGDSSKIIFEIEDNGIGMDRETREKAFSLFFSSKGAGGTGLGLFIANKIAQAHGGSIAVTSEEGKGSHFVVELLRKRPDIKENEEKSESTSGGE
ncbi:MAG TPA: PAS domain-containing sensor histidine kinase [candidate division Zixibacteria bacterium]|nr:PAS domain-containing sensor histidine kinase [candidate division Zixibacteria bacterium]